MVAVVAMVAEVAIIVIIRMDSVVVVVKYLGRQDGGRLDHILNTPDP